MPIQSKTCLSYGKALFTMLVMLAFVGMALPAHVSALASADARTLFIENQGQLHGDVAYYADTFAGRVFVTRTGTVVTSVNRPSHDTARNSGANAVAIYERLAGGKVLDVTADQPTTTQMNFLDSPAPSEWRSSVPTFERVSMGEVFPGIRVSLHAKGRNIERFFHLAPGANPRDIQIAIEGVDSLSLNKEGELILQSALGPVAYSTPIAWQESALGRDFVEVAYRLDSQGLSYGFDLGSYDQSRELIIDPLLAATFIGGGNEDRATALVEHAGSIYLAGRTISLDFPSTPGAYDTLQNGPNGQLFISRFDMGLTTLQASTFFGLQFNDTGSPDYDVYLDAHGGDIYLAFNTVGSGNPTSAVSFDQTFNGMNDAFVARLSGDLTTLEGSTYFGGTHLDLVTDLDVDDSSGNVCIGGSTRSSIIPTTGGAHDQTYNGDLDGFVACFNSNLSGLLKSTYYGTGSADGIQGIHAFAGNVFAGGFTHNANVLPTPNGAFQSGFGARDGFVAFFGANLQLVSATLIGGADADIVHGVQLNSGNVYVSGYLEDGTGFPIGGGFDTTYNGDHDAFIASFNGLLGTLQSSTFLGGSDNDRPHGLEIDAVGNLYLLLHSDSPDFPTTPGAFQENDFLASSTLVKVSSNLGSLLYSTWLRGLQITNSSAQSVSFAVPSLNNVFLPGTGNPFSMVPDTAYQPTRQSSRDGLASHYVTLNVNAEVSMGFLPIDIGEDNGPLVIEVNRTGDPAGMLEVFWETTDGTAVDGQDYTGDSDRLEWQPGDNTSRFINVPILNDNFHEAAESFTVSLSDPAGARIADFGGGRTINIIDNDPAEVIVSAPAPDANLTELPDSLSFTVRLGSEPQGGLVFLTALSDDTSAGTLQGADTNGEFLVTFGAGNWNIPQPLTVHSVDDDVDDGDQMFQIDFLTLLSADSDYDGQVVPPVDLTTIDDDNAGIAFDFVNSPLVTSETGTSDSLDVTLTSQPLASVQLSFTPDADGLSEGMLSSPNLVFLPSDWDVPQTLTVTGLDDMIIDGDILYSVFYSGLSTDPLYDFSQTNFGPQVINLDDDAIEVDVSVTVDDGDTQMLPFVPTLYQISVNNAAPEPINDLMVVTTASNLNSPGISWVCLPSGMSNCDAASGTGNINTTVDLEPNGSVSFELTAVAINDPFEQAVLTVEAILPFGYTDTDPMDNFAMDSNLIFVFIIFKDGLETP